MNILVLGGNGFIGSHIVDELLLHGHEVSVLHRSAEKYVGHSNKVRFYLGDYSDSVKLGEALEGVDAVIHAISTTVPSTSNLNPTGDVQQNLVGTIQLLELMTKAKVTRLIYLSSGGTVYGNPQQLPVPENHPLNPICSYGIVKVAIENYIGMYKELYGLKPIILRPSNPYGPRQAHSGVQGALSTFLSNTLSHKEITIWGNGEIKRGYIYVKDLAKVCRLAVESDIEGTFNVCSGVSQTLNDLLVLVETTTGITPKVSYKPSRLFDVKEILLDTKKVNHAFDWSATYSIQDGLADFLKHLA
jgi:UDP-glucose 4-epimerase